LTRALLAGGIALAVAGTALPAATATSGDETVSGILVTSGTSGTRTAIAAPPLAHPVTYHEEDVDRYAAVRQYSLGQILAVWAAAALPMGILAWIVAPRLADTFAGAGDVPMMKALLICLTGGLIWQFVLVLALVGREQGTSAGRRFARRSGFGLREVPEAAGWAAGSGCS
jgi:hypothetical protein